MLLSVVIPFYHVEKYIGDCLALTAQLPQDACEILLVDDCGVDSCAQIAADYCARYANMRICVSSAGRKTEVFQLPAIRDLLRRRVSMSISLTATICPSRRR